MNIRDWIINYFKDDAELGSDAGNIGNGIERYVKDFCNNIEPDEDELKILADKAREFYFKYEMSNRRVHDRRQGIAELLAGHVPFWLNDERSNIVKDVCKALGITQKELAEILGVNVSSVTNWATGKVEIPSVVLKCFDLLLVEKKFKQIKELIKDNID